LPLTKEEKALVKEALEMRGEAIAQAGRFIQATCDGVIEAFLRAIKSLRHA
jgi:hypothetical protein